MEKSAVEDRAISTLIAEADIGPEEGSVMATS
jgi:hypothetical protein